ncbi:MAG: DUF2807 domain-containing protein [Bacteroidia bacterium]
MRFLTIISLFILISCNKPDAPDCFKQNGKTVTIERKLESFKALKSDAHIDIVIANSNEYKAEITGPANLLDKVDLSVNSNTLVVENKNSCNFVRGYKQSISIKIYAPKYDFVVANSVGNISTTPDFNQDTLVVRSEGGDFYIYGNYNEIRTSSHGNGNMYLRCNMNRLYVYMNGTNYLYANEANIASFVFIESISVADAYIKAPESGTLLYNIWKSGSIYYTGNPQSVDGIISGKGTVVKK